MDRAWRVYVKSHYQTGTDIERMLDDISRRAQAWREAMYQKPPPGESRQAGNLSAIMKSLHDTAKAAIQNMR